MLRAGYPACAFLGSRLGGRIRPQRSAIHEIVTPLSTGYTCPVTIRDSSEARNTAMLAMSSGSISPTRCAAASFVTRGLPASSRSRTRSVIVADGAIALTRTLWGANSTAIERVSAATPPFLGHVRRDRDAIPAGLGHDLRGLL